MFEQQLIEIEQDSLKYKDELHPNMAEIFYMYGLIAYQQIENTLPFEDITEQFQEIMEYLSISVEICENQNLFAKIFSLIGDLNALVDLNNVAEISYREALKYTQIEQEILQLYYAILQLRYITLQSNDDTIELFQQAKQLAFKINSSLLDQLFKLEDEWLISLKDNSYEQIQKRQETISIEEKKVSKKYQQMRNLGIFGSQKITLQQNELI